MSSRNDQTQSAIRQRAARARATLSSKQRRHFSEAIAYYTARLGWIKRAEQVGCYLGLRSEVDTLTLIHLLWAQSRCVYLPIIGAHATRRLTFLPFTPQTRLRRNALGIREPYPARLSPIAVQYLDVVIVPLVAFDNQCHRVGMGGGYFDTTFSFLRPAALWRKPRLVGIAFDCQRVDIINPNSWDVPLDAVVTERAIYRRGASDGA